MSYTVLARRYRSETFDQVVGQAHVAQTLKKAIESGRIAHAYLFNGTRGVGKTSMARIMAKALNCEKSDGPTTTPCLKCSSCTGIARGEDIDVVEIDAASNTGVDDVRAVIENAQYRPARSRFKVYIIDEVHMLSRNAFNALLKTLEEPPSHVKFILATTEPEKVPATILSRCQRYDFRNIPTREIAGHLREIAKKEKIKASEDALLMVAKVGAGSMRDALSLLDRLLSVGEKELTAEMIEQLLGLPKSQAVFELTQAIGEGRVKDVLQQADALIMGGLSVDALLGSLAEHLRNLLILRTCGAQSQMVEVPGLAPAALEKQAQRFDAGALSQDITILEELRRQLRTSQAGRALLDATLVRLALADQFSSIEELLARLGEGNGGGGSAVGGVQKKKFEPVESAASDANASEREERPSHVAEVSVAAEPTSTVITVDEDDDDDLPRPGKVWDGPSLAEMMKQETKAKVSASTAAPAPRMAGDETPRKRDAAEVGLAGGMEGETPLPQLWAKLLVALESAGGQIHSVLKHAQMVGIVDEQAVIRFSPVHETFARMWQNNGKRDVIVKALSSITGRSLGVKFEVNEAATAVAEAPASAATVATAAAPAVAPGREAPRPQAGRAPVREPAPPMNVPMGPARPTAEQIAEMSKEPLVAALMSELGAQIVRVNE